MIAALLDGQVPCTADEWAGYQLVLGWTLTDVHLHWGCTTRGEHWHLQMAAVCDGTQFLRYGAIDVLSWS